MRLKLAYLLLATLLIVAVGAVAGCGDDGDETTTTIEGAAGTEPTAPEDGGTATTAGTGTTAGGGQEDGAAVFSQNCAGCHGADGSGGTGPALTATQLDRAQIKQKVTEGGGGMPAFEGTLSEEQIGAVSDYVYDELRQQ
jgi:mono/diheme cytochrome c family protein